MVIERNLSKPIRTGRPTVRGMARRDLVFGTPSADAPHLEVMVRVKNRRSALMIAADPDLRLGEAFMDGMVVVEQGDLWSLLELCGRNFTGNAWRGPPGRLARALRGVRRAGQQMHHHLRAKHNLAHHYN